MSGELDIIPGKDWRSSDHQMSIQGEAVPVDGVRQEWLFSTRTNLIAGENSVQCILWKGDFW